LEADHVVPLTRRGTDDIGNIQPLCGACNRKKFVAIIDYRLDADILL
jgi:5-methylcytosine-specific restriction endonuclease McrA